MNIVFDRKTLKVVSLLDADTPWGNNQDALRSMFPNDFYNLDSWFIRKKISQIPIGLSIRLDENKNPNALIFKGKEIYKATKEDTENALRRLSKEKEKALSSIIPRTLRSSIGTDLVGFWSSSRYTLPNIVSDLKSFRYFSDGEIIPVTWGGPFTDAGGYANMNREIVFRLHNHHIIAKAEVWPTVPQISLSTNYHLSKYSHMNFRRLNRFTRIHGFTPHPISSNVGRVVFFTMMETETLHPEFTRVCNKHADEIWVPSGHNKRVFAESGIKKPIYVMPLGIDRYLYRDEDKPIGVINDHNCFVDLLGRPSSSGINSFRFLSLFGWSYRKGVDILIKSFVEEFNNNDDVSLIICSRHAGSPDPLHQNVIMSETARYAREVRPDKYPQILLYPHITPEHQMPSLYRMGHAFVHFSRGEGFSLPQIEASATGLPVISCNNTGMSEYLSDDNAYLVKTEEKELCSPEMHWISTFYHNQLFPKLGQDQIDQSRKHMRYVFTHYQDALIKGSVLKKVVFEKYTWDNVAERVANRIKQIAHGI